MKRSHPGVGLAIPPAARNVGAAIMCAWDIPRITQDYTPSAECSSPACWGGALLRRVHRD